MRILLTTVVCSLACGAPGSADDAQPKPAMFAVYPIATELQRIRLARTDEESPRMRVYVKISGNELIDKAGVVRLEALPVDEITKALAPYADRESGIVMLNMHFGNESDGSLRYPTPAADKGLRAALEKMGRAAGFISAPVSSSIGGPVLEKKFETVTDKVKGRADEDEVPAGDELVMVYPVRTILSLLLTDNADCVIVIRSPLEQDGENLLSEDVRKSIVKHVAAVKLRDKSKLQISVKTRGSRISSDRFDRFHRVEVMDLARSLGFESASTQSANVN